MRILSDHQEEEVILLYLTLGKVREKMRSGRYEPNEGLSCPEVTARFCGMVMEHIGRIFPDIAEVGDGEVNQVEDGKEINN